MRAEGSTRPPLPLLELAAPLFSRERLGGSPVVLDRAHIPEAGAADEPAHGAGA